MLYVGVRGVMDVVFSVCILTYADVVCLCLMCILGQFSMLHSA